MAHYKVITRPRLADLEADVNDAIRRGATLVGGVNVVGVPDGIDIKFIYTQAVMFP